jgi:hypothetical protein
MNLSTRDGPKPVSVGAPSVRNLGRATIEVVAFVAFWGALAAVIRPDEFPVFPAVMVGALLIAWFVADLLICEVVVSAGIVETRSWLRIGRRARGTTLHVEPGRRLVRMPDGRWQLDGKTIDLNVPRWEARRLHGALADTGFAVEDRRAEWTRDHRRRFMVYRCSWAAFFVGIWGNLAFSTGREIPLQFLCLVVMFAGLAGVFWLRPPQTSGPGPVWRPADSHPD